MSEQMCHGRKRAGYPVLSPEQRVQVLRAAVDLFGTEEVSQRLEHILKCQGIDYRQMRDRSGPICLRRICLDDGSAF